MGKKDQGSRFLTLATEIAGYPVTFKRVPGVAKRLAPIVPPDVDGGVPLAEEAVSKVVKRFQGTPLVINCDGGYKKGVGVTGFSVAAPSGKVCWVEGRCDVGWSNNACECMAIVHALQRVIEKGWKRKGDYILIRSDSTLAVNYLNRAWKQREPALAELVEQIRMLIRKERLLVQFQWVPRSENQLADAVGRQARECETDVSYENDPCDWLVGKYHPSSTSKREVVAAMNEVESNPGPDLTLE